MGTIKDIYEIIKDLMKTAKALENQEMISLAVELQAMFFDLKDENETIKDENKALKEEIEKLKAPSIDEKDIKYVKNGFFTLNSEGNELPYCSACWKSNKNLVPLARGIKAWWHYTCPNCKTDFSIMDDNGNSMI